MEPLFDVIIECMKLQISEYILILTGLILLTGVYVVAQGGDFTVWFIAKGLYVIGVIMFLSNK